MVQWLRIHLAMQGTWVRPLVQDDSTCYRAAKPDHAPVAEPVLRNPRTTTTEADMPRLMRGTHPEPVLCNTGGHCRSSSHTATAEWAQSLQLESPCTATKTQCNQNK